MSHAYQVPSPLHSPSPLPLPPRNKVITQRHYREKEGECFNALRDVIKQLTGEELVTRYEILRKAIDLLLFLPEIKMQEQAGPVVLPAPYEMSVTQVSNLANTHPGYPSQPSQPSHWPQLPWQDVEFDAQNARYTSQPHGQQYYPTSNIDSAFEQGSYHDFSENWSNDPHI
ncbi:hypothetical protein L210DRAFT_942759 [Boletus edulis BED1]|uniref:BHLH domain-containing protein n=1 Tax=Boletus edulis BED1 TaxID=1328754 RepID=A0AAD4GD69_BOLED|nr:hypothetical protein L210DRAFT_942759 [Boletus edulis BED1]